MQESEYIKQLVGNVALNPTAGVSGVSGSIFQNVVFSQKKVLLLGVELMQLAYLSTAGVPEPVGIVDISILRTVPASQLDDTISKVNGALTIVPLSPVFTLFYGYQYGSLVPYVRPVNILLDANQKCDIVYAVRFMSAAVGTEFLQLTTRVFWQEID